MENQTKKTKVEKGSVYIQTDKGVFPYSTLEKAELTSPSKQVNERERWRDINDLVTPPFPPESFLLLYESNPIFWRCVNQIATDVAGLGWSLRLREDKKEDKTEHARMKAFLDKPNSEEALRTLLKQCLVDWGSIGWFGLEVVRNNKKEIDSIYHVPAHTFRVHKNKKKYCQMRGTKKVWFKKFGLEKDISAKDGKIGTYTIKTRANELIYFRNFYPRSDFYGAPNILSATGDVMGLIGMRDYNLAFFENYGVPSAVIVLEGSWDKDSAKTVAQYLNKEIKGTDNAHKTLAIKQPDGCKFHYTPLNAKVKEGSFKLYEQARRDNVLIAYSMPPERVGVRVTGSLGQNVAEEATRIYVESVVEPLQLDLEFIINTKLIPSETYEFKFENIDLRDLHAEIEIALKQIEHAVKTPNEVRNQLGLKPYAEGGDKFYMMSSIIEVGESEEPLSKLEKDFLDKENAS